MNHSKCRHLSSKVFTVRLSFTLMLNKRKRWPRTPNAAATTLTSITKAVKLKVVAKTMIEWTRSLMVCTRTPTCLRLNSSRLNFQTEKFTPSPSSSTLFQVLFVIYAAVALLDPSSARTSRSIECTLTVSSACIENSILLL